MPNDAHARQPPASCHGTLYRSSDRQAVASPQSFSLVQRKAEATGRRRVHITGQVLVEKADKGSDITVDIEYRSNVESLLEELALKRNTGDSQHDSALELWVPEYTDKRSMPWHGPCLDIDVVITVPPDASYDSFHLSVKTLNIVFSELSYTGSNTTLEVRTGSVYFAEAAHVHTRVIRVHAGTSSVKGTYPLLDLLDIQTQTGSIDVALSPQAADKHELPAKLQVDSNTGSIRVHADLSNLLDRDYQTSIRSGTGSIQVGPLMHGSMTTLQGRTATIDGTLTPVGPLDEASAIEVISNTGSVTVAVAPHFAHQGKAMRHLNGKYTSHTGRVQLTHPLQWEGTVKAETGTGSVNVDWPGLSQTGEEGGDWIPGFKWPGGHFEGKKGKGEAFVEASSGTGSIKLIGKDVA
jgi:hypothetical protein